MLNLNATRILSYFLISLAVVGLANCGEDEPTPLLASIGADRLSINEGEQITFSDQSSGEATSWEWSFEGGTPATSTEESPTVTYAVAGAYDVTLRVSGPEGTSSITEESYVRVGCTGLYCADSFNVSVINNIIYGKDSAQHLLNLYQPDGDQRTERPVVILFGGGAFQGSNLDYLDELARNICSRGMVVAAGRYRNGNDPQADMIRGHHDIKAAVRYFKANRNVWRVDTSSIIMGGYGTGAFLTLMAGYMDYDELDASQKQILDGLGGMEGNQGHPGYSSNVAGVLSLAGGMYGGVDMISSDDPPLYAVHGTSDQDVPYGCRDLGNGFLLCGSKPLVDKAKAEGLETDLYTLSGGDHSAPRRLSDQYIEELMWFWRRVLD